MINQYSLIWITVLVVFFVNVMGFPQPCTQSTQNVLSIEDYCSFLDKCCKESTTPPPEIRNCSDTACSTAFQEFYCKTSCQAGYSHYQKLDLLFNACKSCPWVISNDKNKLKSQILKNNLPFYTSSIGNGYNLKLFFQINNVGISQKEGFFSTIKVSSLLFPNRDWLCDTQRTNCSLNRSVSYGQWTSFGDCDTVMVILDIPDINALATKLTDSRFQIMITYGNIIQTKTVFHECVNREEWSTIFNMDYNLITKGSTNSPNVQTYSNNVTISINGRNQLELVASYNMPDGIELKPHEEALLGNMQLLPFNCVAKNKILQCTSVVISCSCKLKTSDTISGVLKANDETDIPWSFSYSLDGIVKYTYVEVTSVCYKRLIRYDQLFEVGINIGKFFRSQIVVILTIIMTRLDIGKTSIIYDLATNIFNEIEILRNHTIEGFVGYQDAVIILPMALFSSLNSSMNINIYFQVVDTTKPQSKLDILSGPDSNGGMLTINLKNDGDSLVVEGPRDVNVVESIVNIKNSSSILVNFSHSSAVLSVEELCLIVVALVITGIGFFNY